MSKSILISEFRKATSRSATEKFVDLDSSFKERFDFEVLRFEDVFTERIRGNPPNRWSYHRIGFIKKGSGEFITGMYKFKATKNTLVVVPARVITSSKKWTLNMKGYVVLFNPDFFLKRNFPLQLLENKKILSGSNQPYIQLTDSESAEIESIYENLLLLKGSKSVQNEELLTLKVLELLAQSERLFDQQLHFEENLPLMDIIKRYTQLVETHFMDHRLVSFYAKELNVHPNYLNALIKNQTGRTAKESIQNRLLLEIKYLLHSTDLSIKEIASQLGFSDSNYFTSFFTRHENISPSKYRSSFI